MSGSPDLSGQDLSWDADDARKIFMEFLDEIYGSPRSHLMTCQVQIKEAESNWNVL